MDGQSEYQQVKNRILKILQQTATLDIKKISELTPWYELNAESYELVEFIVALRDEFNVNINTQDLIKAKNLKDIIDYIYKNKK